MSIWVMRADAQHNRKEIITTARRLFAQVGIDVPVDVIAERAEVGIGTFYRHFPTKDTLINAVVLDEALRMIEEARRAMRGKDAGAAFFELLSQLVLNHGQKKDLLAALAKCDRNHGEGVATVSNDLWQVIAALLSRAQAHKAVRTDLDVITLKAILNGFCGALDTLGGDQEMERKVWLVLCDGIRNSSTSERVKIANVGKSVSKK